MSFSLFYHGVHRKWHGDILKEEFIGNVLEVKR